MKLLSLMCSSKRKNLFFLFAAFQLLVGPTCWAGGPEPFTIESHYNYLDGSTNEWVSSGAFVDSGVIGASATVHSDTPGVSKVLGPMISDDGSTITWSFHKKYTSTLDPYVAAASGEFHIISGTGKYEGIKGHGQVNGLVNVVTGEIVDVFTGRVNLP